MTWSGIARTMFYAAALWCAASPAVDAETMEWKVQNTTRVPLNLELYSQNRPAAWPGNGEAFVVPNNGETFSQFIECNGGERICYGAWHPTYPNAYWGVGQNQYQCQDCCYICQSSNYGTVGLDRATCHAELTNHRFTAVPTRSKPRLVSMRSPELMAQTGGCDFLGGTLGPDTPPPTPAPSPTCRPGCAICLLGVCSDAPVPAAPRPQSP